LIAASDALRDRSRDAQAHAKRLTHLLQRLVAESARLCG
jgi:hypothetical protein